MARKLRLEKQGMLYHVICRGQRKNPLFFSNEDMNQYCRIVNYCLTQYDVQILAYCLMRNHVHLLIKRNSMPLADFMHRVNTLYAIYFNTKYNLVGHVFQGRYKAYPVLEEVYYYSVINYIHDNPRRANIVSVQYMYPYSSAHLYNGKYCDSGKIFISPFSGERKLIENIENMYDHNDYYIGTKEEYMRLEKRDRETYHRHFTDRRKEDKLPIKVVFAQLCNDYNINPDLITKSKHRREYLEGRRKIICNLYEMGYSQAKIASLFHISQQAVGKIIKSC